MEKTKLTKLEKYWILYDVGNSAFILLVSTIIPIYFNAMAEAAGLSEVDYLAYWGYAASVSTILVTLIGPVFGTIADTKGFKKPIFIARVMVGVLGCAALSLPLINCLSGSVCNCKSGYSSSLVFYDAMLSDVTTHETMDMVSSHGYAWGYLGSCIPFVFSLAVVLLYEQIGITMTTAMAITFFLKSIMVVSCNHPTAEKL